VYTRCHHFFKQFLLNKSGTNKKRKQNGGVLITKETQNVHSPHKVVLFVTQLLIQTNVNLFNSMSVNTRFVYRVLNNGLFLKEKLDVQLVTLCDVFIQLIRIKIDYNCLKFNISIPPITRQNTSGFV